MTDEMKVMIFACKVTRGPRSCSPRVARHRGARLSLIIEVDDVDDVDDVDYDDDDDDEEEEEDDE